MAELGNKELSGRVIEAVIAVYSALGPGFIESVYESALCVELNAQGTTFEPQKTIAVVHREEEVGHHRFDLVVEDVLLVELNAVKAYEDIFFAVGHSQMRAARITDGLNLNFAAMPLSIKRIGPGLAGS